MLRFDSPKGLCLLRPGAAAIFLAPFAPSAAFAAPLNYLLGHGDKAYPVVALTWGVTIIAAAVIVIIALLVSGAIWHRRGLAFEAPGHLLETSRPGRGASWIWMGVGLSSLVLLFAIVWTMRVLAQVAYPSSAAPFTIEVTGKQWWWQVRYLADDTARVFATANEIHIPTGVPLKFKLIGGDVIHSFWVPALSGKTDTIPGQTNETWLEAKRPGVYRGQCTEYCGLQHAHMGMMVVAQTPQAFRAWWDHQLQSPAPTTNGQVAAGRIDFAMHCGSCHTVRGTEASGILGPDLSHLMTRRTIAAATLPNTPANLVRWISDPQGVKPGAFMQKPELTSHELADILAYLKSLK
ncbi:MAG TPA: c-type cytochrome [Rhizomicrobium sp.]|nr:c-type cytochrome [Rhizomicrobium sp.]